MEIRLKKEADEEINKLLKGLQKFGFVSCHSLSVDMQQYHVIGEPFSRKIQRFNLSIEVSIPDDMLEVIKE